MALLNKANKIDYVSKKVNFEESTFEELKKYMEFLGFEPDKEESRAITHIVNEALQYVFSKDKDYKKYKDQKKKDEQQNTTTGANILPETNA